MTSSPGRGPVRRLRAPGSRHSPRRGCTPRVHAEPRSCWLRLRPGRLGTRPRRRPAASGNRRLAVPRRSRAAGPPGSCRRAHGRLHDRVRGQRPQRRGRCSARRSRMPPESTAWPLLVRQGPVAPWWAGRRQLRAPGMPRSGPRRRSRPATKRGSWIGLAIGHGSRRCSPCSFVRTEPEYRTRVDGARGTRRNPLPPESPALGRQVHSGTESRLRGARTPRPSVSGTAPTLVPRRRSDRKRPAHRAARGHLPDGIEPSR